MHDHVLIHLSGTGDAAMNSKIGVFIRWVDAMTEWIGKLASLMLIPMCLLLVYEVIMRYLLDNPTIFAQETSIYLYGGIGMFGGAYTLLYKGHVSLDIIYGRLSARRQAILDIITSPLFFLFCIVLIWQGWEMGYVSWTMDEHSPSPWGPPLYPIKLVIPVATGLLLLQGVVKLVRDIYIVVTGKELS